MENIYITLLAIAALVVGIFGGFYFDNPETLTVEVPGPVTERIVNFTITEEIEVPADIETFLDTALEDLFEEYDRDDDWLTCDDVEFDDDEVSYGTVYEWSYTWLDDDQYEVSGEFKFEGEEDKHSGDDCSERRLFTVFYEDGEDPEFDWELA